MSRRLSQDGFSLVEILFVGATLILLASVVLFNASDARKKSRDTKRLADLKELQVAFEAYRQDSGQLPEVTEHIGSGGSLDSILLGYLAEVPTDPVNADGFRYRYSYDPNGGGECGDRAVVYAESMELSGNVDTQGCDAIGVALSGDSSQYVLILK